LPGGREGREKGREGEREGGREKMGGCCRHTEEWARKQMIGRETRDKRKRKEKAQG